MSGSTIALIGFLDTKLAEYEFVRRILIDKGYQVIVLDTSIRSSVTQPNFTCDYTPETIYKEAGLDPTALQNITSQSRDDAFRNMSRGAQKIIQKLPSLSGVFGLGGSSSTSLICDVLRPLPIGFPKVCVSTMVSGDVSIFVGDSDILLVPSIVDMSGYLNAISKKILTNAAYSIAAMASGYSPSKRANFTSSSKSEEPALVGVTMFGLTTPCVTAVCEYLRDMKDEAGRRKFEPVVFHATGSGGRTMERLLKEGWLKGVLDITTTELADELCGGVLSAGPDRLTVAGSIGVPQIISLGALDMINFGPYSTLPKKYTNAGANTGIHKHNDAVTLVRTSLEECTTLGRLMADKLKVAKGRVKVVIPLKGWSGIDVEGGSFWNPEADQALVESLKRGLEGSSVEVIELDYHINDREMAEHLAKSFAAIF